MEEAIRGKLLTIMGIAMPTGSGIVGYMELVNIWLETASLIIGVLVGLSALAYNLIRIWRANITK